MCTAQVRGGAGGSVKRDLCSTTHMRTGQRRRKCEEVASYALACCAHARLGEEHTHERLLCGPRQDSARDQQREREREREGGECAGNAIKCPLPGVEIGGTWLDCGFSLPEARCWCDYCDGLRCCFIFFISYVCIIDDNDDEPDNNGDASGHGRWAAQRRRPFAYLANNNNGQRQWPNAAGSPGFSPSSGILIDECYPCSRRGTSSGYPKPCHA